MIGETVAQIEGTTITYEVHCLRDGDAHQEEHSQNFDENNKDGG